MPFHDTNLEKLRKIATSLFTLEELKVRIKYKESIRSLKRYCLDRKIKFRNPLEKSIVKNYLENHRQYAYKNLSQIKEIIGYEQSLISLAKLLMKNGIFHKPKRPPTISTRPHKEIDPYPHKARLLRMKRTDNFTLYELMALVKYQGSIDDFKASCNEIGIAYQKD